MQTPRIQEGRGPTAAAGGRGGAKNVILPCFEIVCRLDVRARRAVQCNPAVERRYSRALRYSTIDCFPLTCACTVQYSTSQPASSFRSSLPPPLDLCIEQPGSLHSPTPHASLSHATGVLINQRDCDSDCPSVRPTKSAEGFKVYSRLEQVDVPSPQRASKRLCALVIT